MPHAPCPSPLYNVTVETGEVGGARRRTDEEGHSQALKPCHLPPNSTWPLDGPNPTPLLNPKGM
jgi:hypothetical protein